MGIYYHSCNHCGEIRGDHSVHIDVRLINADVYDATLCEDCVETLKKDGKVAWTVHDDLAVLQEFELIRCVQQSYTVKKKENPEPVELKMEKRVKKKRKRTKKSD